MKSHKKAIEEQPNPEIYFNKNKIMNKYEYYFINTNMPLSDESSVESSRQVWNQYDWNVLQHFAIYYLQ